MIKLIDAANAAGFNPDKLDMAVLVGIFAAAKRWADADPNLKALGKASVCDGFREEGKKLLDALQAECEPEESEIVLRVYRTPSGQWAGVLLAGNEEIGRSADCESPDAVKDAAIESGFIADRIEVV